MTQEPTRRDPGSAEATNLFASPRRLVDVGEELIVATKLFRQCGYANTASTTIPISWQTNNDQISGEIDSYQLEMSS